MGNGRHGSRYVTWDELAAVSSYLVARTPLEKVGCPGSSSRAVPELGCVTT